MIGIEGAKVTHETQLFLKETGAGGVILFKKNIVDPKQVARFIADLNDAAGEPLIVGVDQEGGRVARLAEPFTRIPSMAAVGRTGDERLAFKIGQLLARELSTVGFTVDFAPVLDVATNAFNPVIGDRAFSDDPQKVARLGAAFVRGIQGEGVAACGKHFPGHGDTDVDSHMGLPVLHHTRRRFDVCELVPFRAAVGGGVASIMTAHIMVPNVGGGQPATLSRTILTRILRGELGFDGLAFTDDLGMRGVADLYPPGESAWRAIWAGADVAMVCHRRENQRQALEGLRRAVGEGRIDKWQIDKSLARIAAFKRQFCDPTRQRPPMDVIGCREHRRIVEGL